jgi:hypothetical protein
MQVDDVGTSPVALSDITNTVANTVVTTVEVRSFSTILFRYLKYASIQPDCGRASVVRLPFASVPGMDIFSTAYKRAVQVSIAPDQSLNFPLVSEENRKYFILTSLLIRC